LVLFAPYGGLGVLVDVKIRNPTIEEQALARIHRIGQKKEVTTIRFFVKDTFEEVSSLIRSNGIRESG